MKIYILCDMEGVSGIRRPEQVQRDSPEYAEGCALMMQDINACIDGAFRGGASEVAACDTHGGGGQIRLGEMDPRAVYETPVAGSLMPALDASFAGVVLLGHHAKAGTLNGFLDHTMNSGAWFDYRINGRSVGEIGIEAAYAAHWGVPVIMVSGDQAAALEGAEILGDAECAVVKWGIGRNRARCLSLPRAHAEIRSRAERAVKSAAGRKCFRPDLPATLELTIYRTDMADDLAARHKDLQRTDARTVRRVVNSLKDVCI